MANLPETSGVVLCPEDAAVAMRAYDVVGYAVVGLKYDGAYFPETEVDNSLVLDDMAARALLNCVTTTLRKDVRFRDRFTESYLLNQTIIPRHDILERYWGIVASYDEKIARGQQVSKVLFDYVTREAIGDESDNEASKTAAA